jgi:uncharacterized alkaline shock family protein YloU
MSTPEPGIEVRIGEPVITTVAGHYARKVPGVAALRPKLIHGMLSLAGRLAHGQATEPWSAAGIQTTTDGQNTQIEITLSSRSGYNCRELAETIQHQVRTRIATLTGLAATVGITITDIDPNTDHKADPEHPDPGTARHTTPPKSPTPQNTGDATGVAEAARRIETALADLDTVRLHARPPFETLPRWPGHPPAGLELTNEAITIHLTVAALPLPPLLDHLGHTLRAALTDTECAHTPIRLHVDQLDGNPFPPE